MQFLSIFMCTGVHRKGAILTEEVSLGGLDTILTKERAFGHQGMINHGEATGKYWYRVE